MSNHLAQIFDHSFIGRCIAQKIPVTVFLTNGVKLLGRIIAVENTPVLTYVLERDGHQQLVHVHGVSTVMPDRVL